MNCDRCQRRLVWAGTAWSKCPKCLTPPVVTTSEGIEKVEIKTFNPPDPSAFARKVSEILLKKNYFEEEEIRATHSFHNYGMMNFQQCEVCRLQCSRASGGGGWGPGEWKYYDKLGAEIEIYPCKGSGH